MHFRFAAIAVLLTTCLATLPQKGWADEASPTTAKVLLVTGEDYPGHKWRETSPVLMAELAKDERLRIEVLDDLKQLASTDLSEYDAVVMHFKNYDPNVPGRAGYDNLAKFVNEGGGLMLVHFACGAFQEFKGDFVRVGGRVWFGQQAPAGRRQHDPRGVFTVNITDVKHPITEGLTDFETLDELYTCLEGDAPISVLATAKSKMDGKPYPIAFVLQHGKGRVFHSVLGHDTAAFSGEGPSELHRRGCAWIAGLKCEESTDG